MAVLDIANYPDQKQAGNVELRKYGDSCQCVIRRFSPDTGKEIAPDVSVLYRDNIIAELSLLEKRTAALKMLLADFDATAKAP